MISTLICLNTQSFKGFVVVWGELKYLVFLKCVNVLFTVFLHTECNNVMWYTLMWLFCVLFSLDIATYSPII